MRKARKSQLPGLEGPPPGLGYVPIKEGPRDNGPPKVLIVGAGLGGLTLGILLHLAEVEFEIIEKASVIKPLGK